MFSVPSEQSSLICTDWEAEAAAFITREELTAPPRAVASAS